MVTYVIWDLGETLTTPPNGRMDTKPLTEYPEIELREHVLEVLELISHMGLKHAILSNTATSDSDVVRELLKRLQILDKFDYVYATKSELDLAIPEKPDSVVYHHVLEKLDIKAEEAVMIGNTWDTDIIGANRVGMHAIWLQNPEVSVREDFNEKVITPPWILPVWDVASVPQAIELIVGCSEEGDRE
ncbi:HAD family hydrolase [Oceanobacillus sp. J11TS1]|uniref:HAD family hydrolase n=1 Tax=Oceanobacillus sp. J11TS1 TaxID=2807191 RepID=UPI001B06EC0F|nr:HAD family hydrolase [Oceanobacillus sp. J11TS1]GIO24141.1 hydrolase [Oceanobacillus sp. J11TS1]